MNEINPCVPNVHFELIPICNLVSNQETEYVIKSFSPKIVPDLGGFTSEFYYTINGKIALRL